MSLFKSYWTVGGISPDARDAAIRAADSDSEELGFWLSRLINKVGMAERDAAAMAQDSAEELADESAEDIVEEAGQETAADTGEDLAEAPDDKLSSIERAMLQPRAASNAAPG